MSQKMNEEAAAKGGLKAALANLSERERRMLQVMVAVLAVLIMVVVIGLARRSVAELEAQTRQYQGALSLLATEGPVYAASQGLAQIDPRLERFSDEVLDGPPVQLTSFVATHAAATGINVSSYDEDQTPLGTGSSDNSGPMIIERILRVEIRQAKMNSLLELMDRIEESREPVVIKRIDIRALRDEGEVRGRLFISTFERRQEENR